MRTDGTPDESGSEADGSGGEADELGGEADESGSKADESGSEVRGETATGGSAYTFDDVTVVMGTYNEEAAVETVLSDIERVTGGAANVVVVDSSEDRTAELARANGAEVIEQPPRGYGEAVRTAVLTPDRPVVVTTDCDDTYPMEALPRFLDRINEGYDVVSGDRLYHGAEAMPAFNRLGNAAFAALASLLVGERLHDVTTGMRAYRRSLLQEIRWTENTGLSAELLLRPVTRGYDVVEEPISYGQRAGETTLDPISGGAAIGKSILRVGLEEWL